MYLALNFPRIDPAHRRGRDLSRRSLPEPGPGGPQRRSLRGNVEGRRTSAGSTLHRRRGAGPHPRGSNPELRSQLGRGHRSDPLRLHRRVHQHVCSRRDHSPGGRSRRSVHANSLRFKNPLVRRLYLLGKMLDPKYMTYRSIERPAVFAPAAGPGDRRQQHGPPAHPNTSSCTSIADSRGSQRDRRPAHEGRTARRGSLHFRNRLGLEPSDLVGLFVGHNFALKGLRPLLRALGARNRPGARPVHLLVCGGGPVARYRRMARSLGVDQTVHFLGFHDDIRECFAASDFFVMPSYYDPCSLVVLEALACGLPVITTAKNGASELYGDGREGYILTSPDAQGELVAALEHMTDDARRRAMSARAAMVGAEHAFDHHVAALVRVFEEVAAERGNHPGHGKHGSSRPHAAHSSSGRKQALVRRGRARAAAET